MVCAVSLHYPYKIHEVMKLTPRQLDVMFRTLAKKIEEEIKIKAAMFGVDIGEKKETLDGSLDDYDMLSLDRNSEKFDEIMKCRKPL
jgi:hypothetical protein